MKKAIIFVAVLVLVVLIGVVTFVYIDNNKTNEHADELKITIKSYLEAEDYASVFNMYNTEDSKYYNVLNNELEVYVNTLCQEAVDSLSLDKIIRFRDAGGNFVIINDAIVKIENKLTEIDNSNENYVQAVNEYNSRNYDAARAGFQLVIVDDINYQSAQNYIAEMNLRENSWNENISGRSSFLNACAFDGEYLYIPFVLDGVDGIYKITGDGKAVDFFPLSNDAGELFISGINVVGDYIYFIAGENTGSGYTFNDPYSIYEMKTDGTNLNMVLGGNFADLYIKNDKAYVVSREFGLLEYDRYFRESKTISEGIVADFSVSDSGLYYTVQSDLTHNSENSVYYYDGQTSEFIVSEEYLHYYSFGDVYIKHWQQDPTIERLKYCVGDNVIKVRHADIYAVYGLLQGRVIYSCNGSLGRETLYAYQVDNSQTYQLHAGDEVIEYEIKGIFYEQEQIIIEENGKLYFCNTDLVNRVEIANIQSSNNLLENNYKVINHLQNDDIYSDSADEKIISVISDKQVWHYKDDVLNVTIEKRYMDKYDCNVYVTHIYTKDYSLLTTGNGKSSLTSAKTYNADDISAKYNTIFAQSTDTFLHEANDDKGMIIRHGQVIRSIFFDDMFVLFDDGSAEVYRAGDDVTSNMLIENGATTSFSFGPILVEDYKIDPACVNDYPSGRNPRSAIGYVEPGHYVLIASDGRDYEVARGLEMIQLAKIFEEEGCKIAYNLDGGMTTAVLFMGNYVTNRAEYGKSEWFYYRKIAEIFYVGTNENSPAELRNYACDYEYFSNNYK